MNQSAFLFFALGGFVVISAMRMHQAFSIRLSWFLSKLTDLCEWVRRFARWPCKSWKKSALCGVVTFTSTECRAVIDVWGFSEGAVGAADIMMVSANHNRGLCKRRNMRHWRRFHLALVTRHLWWNHLGQTTASYRDSPISHRLVNGQSNGNSSLLVRVQDPCLGSHNLRRIEQNQWGCHGPACDNPLPVDKAIFGSECRVSNTLH